MADSKPPKPTVLLQLDTDPQPSVFDAMVAIDSGVDHVLRHGGVRSDQVRDLVHGLVFTRGGDDLRRSAIFVGGSDARGGLRRILAGGQPMCFFGPFRVSVLLDSRGANTTAAAAALAIGRSLGDSAAWGGASVAILGAGPVGRRMGRLLARLGAKVAIGSPDADQMVEGTEFLMEPGWPEQVAGATAIVAAGPAGVEILPKIGRDRFPHLKVAVDLNAVPPHGVGTVKSTDADEDRDGVRCWGALGVGGLKMKIHKAVVRRLFDAEPRMYDVEQVYEVGREVLAQGR